MRIQYVLFALIFFCMSAPVFAADISINCSSNSCSNSKLELFGSTKNWYPGMWVKKTLEVKNTNSKDGILVKIKSREQELDTTSCQLESKMVLSISNASTKAVLWGGSLHDFYRNANAIPLTSILAKNTQEYAFIISFNQESTNECQGSTTSFALDIYIETADMSQTNAICEDTAPQKAPVLVSVIKDAYGFTLEWQPAQDPVSYYSIAYGSIAGSYTAFNANAGGHDTTSYTLSGLDKDKQYFFAIRAGNGCAVSPYSNEVSINVPTPSPTPITNYTTQKADSNEPTIAANSVSTIPNQPQRSDESQPLATGSVLGESVSKTPEKNETILKRVFKNNGSIVSRDAKKNMYTLILIPIFLLFLFVVPKKHKKRD